MANQSNSVVCISVHKHLKYHEESLDHTWTNETLHYKAETGTALRNC